MIIKPQYLENILEIIRVCTYSDWVTYNEYAARVIEYNEYWLPWDTLNRKLVAFEITLTLSWTYINMHMRMEITRSWLVETAGW